MKIEFNVPKELEEEMKSLSDIEKSLLLTKIFEERFKRLARLKKITSKSQLTEKDVNELSEKIDKNLSKRFIKSIKE
jgi:hypothetical protein